MSKKWIWLLFGLMVVAQLFIPFQMVFDAEKTVTEGTAFKLKTRPYDPKDPFRGNYIRLQYDIGSYTVSDTSWNKGDEVYAMLRKDNEGFAEIRSVLRFEPGNKTDFLKGRISSTFPTEGGLELRIDFGLNRFYMQEEKALIAEKLYNKAAADSTKQTYALVSVESGSGILRDVLIDGESVILLAEIDLINQEKDTVRVIRK